jgi:hypothetical protein
LVSESSDPVARSIALRCPMLSHGFSLSGASGDVGGYT